MISKIIITLFITISYAFVLPIKYDKTNYKIHKIEGKGFGGGEATRDPNPTYYDPNDSKAKQTAIFKAETYAEYRARLNGFPVQQMVKTEHNPSVTYEQYIDSRKLKQYNEYYVPYNPSHNRGQEFGN